MMNNLKPEYFKKPSTPLLVSQAVGKMRNDLDIFIRNKLGTTKTKEQKDRIITQITFEPDTGDGTFLKINLGVKSPGTAKLSATVTGFTTAKEVIAAIKAKDNKLKKFALTKLVGELISSVVKNEVMGLIGDQYKYFESKLKIYQDEPEDNTIKFTFSIKNYFEKTLTFTTTLTAKAKTNAEFVIVNLKV